MGMDGKRESKESTLSVLLDDGETINNILM